MGLPSLELSETDYRLCCTKKVSGGSIQISQTDNWVGNERGVSLRFPNVHCGGYTVRYEWFRTVIMDVGRLTVKNKSKTVPRNPRENNITKLQFLLTDRREEP